MSRYFLAFGVTAVLCLSSVAQAADDLPLGVWQGQQRVMPRNPGGQVQNRPLSLEIRKVPDPHARWRGTDEVVTVTLVRQNQRTEINSIQLSGTTLSFSFQRGDDAADVSLCELMRQPDGSFRGTCTKAENAIFILTPPEPEKPAGVPPASSR